MIACSNCAKREVPAYSGEWFKRVVGTAKEDMLCDYCVPPTPISKGDACAAESMAPNHIPYFEWEGEFLYINNQRPAWEKDKK